MSAAALGREIAEGRADPREVAAAFLEAVASHPDAALIYARTTPEHARRMAEAAAKRREAGRPAGPLDGVPVSWKDNIDTAGVATEAGTRLLAGRVPAVDAPVFARGAEAGLVCLGKTHLSELAFSGLGVNPVTATPPNAHDPALAPGGSSSGAAVSTALGLAAAGIGSDTGGSVRIPAAWNGLVGLKTTHGRLPGEGVVPLAASLDTVGPLARTVEDAAMLLAALDGDPWRTVPDPALPEALVVPETVVLEGCDAQVVKAFEAGLSRLEAAGVALRREPVPEIAECFDTAAALSPIVTREAWDHWGEAIEAAPGTMFPMIEARFRSGAGVEREADAAARAHMAEIGARLALRIAERGRLAMPTVACLPPPVERLLAEETFYTERNLLALRNTRLVNLLGGAAITLPLAAPMCGMMIAGPAGDDEALLAAGRAIEPLVAA